MPFLDLAKYFRSSSMQVFFVKFYFFKVTHVLFSKKFIRSIIFHFISNLIFQLSVLILDSLLTFTELSIHIHSIYLLVISSTFIIAFVPLSNLNSKYHFNVSLELLLTFTHTLNSVTKVFYWESMAHHKKPSF